MSESVIEIDLFSDTVTRPDAAMRAAMAAAEVGDEQLLEDPTVTRLQDEVAALLGTEAALYLPSGAMSNLIAYSVHCRAGDEIILHRLAHPVLHEVGSPSAVIGAVLHVLDGDRGLFTPEQVAGAVRPRDRWHARSRVVSIEQTANAGGGTVWPIEQVRAVRDVAREHGLRVHIDGARLLNAVVASGVPASEWAACADSIWIDLSKGLGAPVGSVLAGSEAFIEQAWSFKQRYGGAMRQAGIIAAAGLHALHTNVERLADDHANARILAEGLAQLPGIALDPAHVDTNIVVFDIAGTGLSLDAFIAAAAGVGVRFSPMDHSVARAVTHLDVTRGQIEDAVSRTAQVLARHRHGR